MNFRGTSPGPVAVLPVFALCLACAVGCGSGRRDTAGSAERGTSRTSQADTPPPRLWQTNFVAPDAFGLEVHTAAVDDTGNTFVVARTPTGGDVYLLYAFDPNGANGRGMGSLGGGEVTREYARAKSAGLVVGGTNYGGGSFSARVFGPGSFYTGAGYTDLQGVDICDDGSVVAAITQHGGVVQGLVIDFDPSRALRWTASLPGGYPTKIRCTGSGAIYVSEAVAGVPTVARFESDGTPDWTWTASDSGLSSPTFDLDGAGDVDVVAGGSGQYVVYAVDPGGNLLWRWASDGPNDRPAGIAASDVITVTGSRAPSGGGPDTYTVQLDTSGNVLWTRDDPAASPTFPAGRAPLAVDNADNVFVCGRSADGSSRAVLYSAADGTTLWTDAGLPYSVAHTDITGSVARCVGSNGASNVFITAYQVQ